MPKPKKLAAKVADQDSSKKLPSQSGSLSPDQMKPLWSFSSIDLGSTWCWTNLTPEHIEEVLTRLKNFETMTWADIKGPKESHPVERYKLIKAAQDRLDEIGLDDLEELFSLRISGLHRVWGILDNHVLRIMWWDPNHEVCPSKLRNT